MKMGGIAADLRLLLFIKGVGELRLSAT